MIERSALQAMFDDIRTNPKVCWSVDDICLWGYFFTDHNETKLQEAIPEFERLGYRVVGILRRSAEDDDPGLVFLHAEKRERHTVDSLHERNLELYRLAGKLGLESYDGMDVGPVGDTAYE